MIKKMKGGLTLTKNELDDIRKASKLCCDNPNVIKYVMNITNLLVQLVQEYAIYYKLDVNAEILNRLHQNNSTSPGQVKNLDAVKEVIKYGNLRERMALIMNFGLKGCDIVIWALATNNHLLTPTFIKEQAARLKSLTGLSILDLQYMLKCKRNRDLNCVSLEDTPCKFGLFTQYGSVILSRYNDFPMLNTVRAKRPELIEVDKLRTFLTSSSENTAEIKDRIDKILQENKEKYSMTIKDIYPPLSEREIDFIGVKSDTIYPPYLSGYMLFDTNEKNYYNILAHHYKQSVIAGPSGSTDLFLITSKMFKTYNLNLGILSCVAWMCNIPQHSVFEILMGALPFGLKDWSPKDDAVKYIVKLNSIKMDRSRSQSNSSRSRAAPSRPNTAPSRPNTAPSRPRTSHQQSNGRHISY
jgi:hypothetical protein